MKKSYLKILIFLSLAILFASKTVFAQQTQKNNSITIIVKDEKGDPIQGAKIFGKEGTVVTKTDASGMFTISIPEGADLLVESDGFESRLFTDGEYKNIKEIRLKATKFNYGEKDNVNIAFGKIKKGNVVGAVSTINPDEIVKYDNIQGIPEALTGRIPGLLGSSNIRGIGGPLYIVDGLPRDISTINLSEVDQITVLKDVNSSMLYGTSAADGVVIVTTKRGQAHHRQVNVSGYYGISVPKELPKYLSSADYMTLYNEARLNDGLTALYDLTSISNYSNGNKYRYPNVDYYSSDYLKSYKPFFKAYTELSGGNDVATYYTNLGWDKQGSLLNFGEGKNAGEDVFNIRGNVDLKINDFIKTSIDAVAVFDNTKGPVGNYWSSASTLKPNLFSPLIPFDLIEHGNKLLASRKNDVDGMYLLGGTSSYLTNPVANGFSGGKAENDQRTYSFTNRIDFDLNKFVTGLAFHTNFSFDFYTSYDQNISYGYSVYQPTWDATMDSIVSLTKYGTDTRTGTQYLANADFSRTFGFYGMLEYNRIFNGVHHVYGSLLGLASRNKKEVYFQCEKKANLGLRLAYAYNDKYMIDFSSAYVNSDKLPPKKRTAFSPSLGLGWVVSAEDFMSSLSAVNYLKLRLSGGIQNTTNSLGDFYYYDDIFRNSGSYSWVDGTYSQGETFANHSANRNLGYPQKKELDFGFDGTFFNHCLDVTADIFTSVISGQVTRPSTLYSSFFSDYIPYENFNENAYRGAEFGITLNQNLGLVNLVLGANALYATSEVKKVDEIYNNSYQYHKGHVVDADYGLVAEGLFQDNADIANHAVQAFGKVQPGDIKYVDQNHDGIIDSNDQIAIGRWQAPFSYGLNLKLNYKHFTLFAEGNGRVGADSYRSSNYYWIDGDDKYSETVLNRWTPDTKATATFPRLSALSNSNNFRASTYWLYRDNYFTVSRIQLTYDVQNEVAKILHMKNLSFYMAGSDLWTISKYRKIKDLSVGSEPYYRSFSIGIKTMF
ncbi:MAG: SusC/RagA family TonB-linked outer membrane protein [Bacteroidota bacterium]|nr:SusC/RagA family TonB-linked outer membrane protein [Bacteroidota bacterium]